MGGPKQSRSFLKKRYLTYSTSIDRHHERQATYTGYVLPVDVLVLLRSLAYQGNDPPSLTGQQWVAELCGWVSQRYKQQFAVVAMVMDNHALVPPGKAKEENKRHTAHKKTAENKGAAAQEVIKPYPKGTVLTEQGVEIPVFDDSDGSLLQTNVETVPMSRLLASRNMRAQLLQLMSECLVKYGAKSMLQYATGKFLIIDYSTKEREGKGGTARNTSADWKEFASVPKLFTAEGYCDLPAEWRHPFGEADNACLWYAHIFKDLNCIIDSIDSDFDNSCLSYLDHENAKMPNERRKGRLLIRYRDQGNGPGGVPKTTVSLDDMDELYACMKADKLSASCYSLFHALGGNDYSLKNEISDGLGVAKIFAAAPSSRSLVKASKLLKAHPAVLPAGKQFVWWQVRYPDAKLKRNTRVFEEICDCLDRFLESVPGTLRVGKGERKEARINAIWSWQYFYQAMFWMSNLAPYVPAALDKWQPELQPYTAAAEIHAVASRDQDVYMSHASVLLEDSDVEM